MIRRALSNMFSNTLRDTLRGNSVNVSIDRLDSGDTRLGFENPAQDIPPEQLPRLFDRFYRVDASSKRRPTGLASSCSPRNPLS